MPALLRMSLPAEPLDVRKAGADTFGGVLRLYLRAPTVWILGAQWLVFAALRLRQGAPTGTDALIVLAVALTWPLQEWAAHRWLLHLEPVRIGRYTFDPFAAYAHRYHHDFPFEKEAIFVPWPVIVALVPIHAGLWWALAPTASLALTGMLAYGGAALLYEWTHFVAHVPWKPSWGALRAIQAHHRAHHFRKQAGWYAFGVPALDRWLGTDPDA